MLIVNANCGIENILKKAHKVFKYFYRVLFTNICLPVMELPFPIYSIDDYHDASIFFKLYNLFHYWMLMVDSLYLHMVVNVESRWKIIFWDHLRSYSTWICTTQTFAWLAQICLIKYIYKKWVPTYKDIQSYCKEDTVIFISHFRILSSFFARYIWCILMFTVFVPSDIPFIDNCGLQTRFREKPQVLQVSPTTSRFW